MLLQIILDQEIKCVLSGTKCWKVTWSGTKRENTYYSKSFVGPESVQ